MSQKKYSFQKDYYKILEIEPNVSEELIWKAYVKLSRITSFERKTGKISPEEHLNKIREETEAYGVLSDPAERRRYDKYNYKKTFTLFFEPNFNVNSEIDYNKIVNRAMKRFSREKEDWEKINEELRKIREEMEEELQRLKEKQEK